MKNALFTKDGKATHVRGEGARILPIRRHITETPYRSDRLQWCATLRAETGFQEGKFFSELRKVSLNETSLIMFFGLVIVYSLGISSSGLDWGGINFKNCALV